MEGRQTVEPPKTPRPHQIEAIDKAILERVTQKYKGQQLFTQKTVAWLNNIIHEKTPQEALASANMAVNKMINKLDNETAA